MVIFPKVVMDGPVGTDCAATISGGTCRPCLKVLLPLEGACTIWLSASGVEQKTTDTRMRAAFAIGNCSGRRFSTGYFVRQWDACWAREKSSLRRTGSRDFHSRRNPGACMAESIAFTLLAPACLASSTIQQPESAWRLCSPHPRRPRQTPSCEMP